MPEHSAVYDQRIYNYLRWIAQQQGSDSLAQAWMVWRHILPSQLLRTLDDLSEMFQASSEHEREQIVARYPLKQIDSILPGSHSELPVHTSRQERERYRAYAHNLAIIASSVNAAVREHTMRAIIPHHVARSMRTALRHSPEYLYGVHRATQIQHVPRPVHTRHSTAVKLIDSVHHIDWSVDVDHASGKYDVVWNSVRPAHRIDIVSRMSIPRDRFSSMCTVVVEPESMLENERYYPVSQEELRRFSHRSAVPAVLYDDGTLSQHPIAYAAPLVRMRVVANDIEISPVTSQVLTLIY